MIYHISMSIIYNIDSMYVYILYIYMYIYILFLSETEAPISCILMWVWTHWQLHTMPSGLTSEQDPDGFRCGHTDPQHLPPKKQIAQSLPQQWLQHILQPWNEGQNPTCWTWKMLVSWIKFGIIQHPVTHGADADLPGLLTSPGCATCLWMLPHFISNVTSKHNQTMNTSLIGPCQTLTSFRFEAYPTIHGKRWTQTNSIKDLRWSLSALSVLHCFSVLHLVVRVHQSPK